MTILPRGSRKSSWGGGSGRGAYARVRRRTLSNFINLFRRRSTSSLSTTTASHAYVSSIPFSQNPHALETPPHIFAWNGNTATASVRHADRNTGGGAPYQGRQCKSPLPPPPPPTSNPGKCRRTRLGKNIKQPLTVGPLDYIVQHRACRVTHGCWPGDLIPGAGSSKRHGAESRTGRASVAGSRSRSTDGTQEAQQGSTLEVPVGT